MTQEELHLIGGMLEALNAQDARIASLENAIVSMGELIQNHDEGIKLIMNYINET